jgi:hypothetical protein
MGRPLLWQAAAPHFSILTLSCTISEGQRLRLLNRGVRLLIKGIIDRPSTRNSPLFNICTKVVPRRME